MDKTLILNKIIDHYGFKKDIDFARYLGIKPQVLSNWKSRNTFDAELLYTKCLELSPKWLLSGQGEMLEIESADKPIKKNNLIPFYDNVESIGGNNYVAEMAGVDHYGDYIDAGDWFPDVTLAIRHYNDSMVEYPSGCILAVKRIFEVQNFVWGCNYVIETSEMRVTKRVQTAENDNFIMAYSTNSESYPDGRQIHEPMKIKKSHITKLFMVLGRIVKEHSSGPVMAKN